MSTQNALLIIDPQYDFCNPNGALFVTGADTDMVRLATWIRANKLKIDHITVTADNHPVNDISHPSFWKSSQGEYPNPFTPITLADIREGIWTPRFNPEKTIEYFEKLEKQGEFGHFIWPYHCLVGSRGAAIDDKLMEAIIEWSLEGKNYQVVAKGTNPYTEHFGIFRANIPLDNQPETHLNIQLIEALSAYTQVFVAGEAKSHCVANSIKQAMDDAPELAKKFVIIEDCMSDVTGLSHLGEPIYKRAKESGIRFAKTTDLIL